MKRIGITILSALAMLSVASVGSASAEIEVGNDCVASGGDPGLTVLQLAKAPGSSLPITVPKEGVVTRWKVKSPFADSVTQRVRVFHPTGGVNEFRTVADGRVELVDQGSNEFDTRIPVQAGDRFGAYGNEAGTGTLYCTTFNGADVLGSFLGNATVGTTQTYLQLSEFQAPVLAVVEPDADNDGYGDETQDGCPADPSTQGACPESPSAPPASPPLPKLSVQGLALRAGGRVIRLFVAASRDASVIAGGQIGWRIKAKKRKPGRRIYGLSGGRRSVSPGQVAAFTVRLPRAVLRHLRRLPSKQSLRAKLSVVATDSSGQTARDPLVVKLRGRARRG